MTQKFGVVALIGAPNAGKSTLLNQIMGTKVSIVCHKVQTTRCRIAGIFTQDSTQIVLLDTPGIFKAKTRFERAMVTAAWEAAFEADDIIFIIDASKSIQKTDAIHILQKLQKAEKKFILVLNKIDKVKKEGLLPVIHQLNETGYVKQVFMVSALKNTYVQDLVHYIKAAMPDGKWLYPEDQLANISERLLAAEITREQVFHQVHDELPYLSAVQTELWQDFDNGAVKIVQIIYIARQGHKGIILGNQGKKIKMIGEKARIELEKILGRKVHLYLHVKIDENWQEKPEHYQDLGLNFR
jgi:GTP-binding protein Era